MKIIKPVFLAALIACTCSCIQEEAPNAEADILSCSLPAEILANGEIRVDQPYDEEIKAYPIYIQVKEQTDRSALAPTFELTEGATISPASGSVQDFTSPVRYTVTSEDQQWHRTYAVYVSVQHATNIPTVFHFETTKDNGKYYEFYEEQNNQSVTWASGNGGYALAVSQAGKDNYPTTLEPNGYIGKCVKLCTQKTGSLGAMVGMPIASGNLFLGQFSITNAITDPLKATQIGIPFYSKPVKLTGYYKYKAGEKFYANGQYTDQKDSFDIYAIFYKSDEEVQFLDGNIATNNFEHPNMVAFARLTDKKETDEWTAFEIPFEYERYGQEIDLNQLQEGKYKIGIVLASSINGALFEGAPGSTLLVDEMELIYE